MEYKELIQKVRQEIVLTLQAITGVKITPGDTLVILDEIQEVPRELHCLKYFFRNSANLYRIA